MKILLSGFDSFGANKTNPTERLMRAVTERPGDFLQPPHEVRHEVRAVVLPTKFGVAFDVLSQNIQSFDPDVVLAFGLAGGRSDAIELERVAINCVDAEIEDNAGRRPEAAPVIDHAPAAYFSTLPLREMRAAVLTTGIPVKISNSAGTYVCNELMFRLLDGNVRTRRRCGFVHVPFLPEQGTPAMSFEMMTRALATLLRTLLQTAVVVEVDR